MQEFSTFSTLILVYIFMCVVQEGRYCILTFSLNIKKLFINYFNIKSFHGKKLPVLNLLSLSQNYDKIISEI